MDYSGLKDEVLVRVIGKLDAEYRDAHDRMREVRERLIAAKAERQARTDTLPTGSASVLLQPVSLNGEHPGPVQRLFRR